MKLPSHIGMRRPQGGLHRVLPALWLIGVALTARSGAQSRAESAPAVKTGRIMGQVLTPDGRPAAGASVRVFRPRHPSVGPRLRGILPEADHDDELRIMCNSDGGFSAPARPGEFHGLLATDGGELMSPFANWLCAGDNAILRLGPTRVIEGTVLVLEEAKASVPAPDLRVCAELKELAPRAWTLTPIARLETRSGPDGAFALRVPRDENLTVRVVEDHRLGGRTLAIGRDDGGPIEIRPQSMRRGTLLDRQDGKPVAGAWVQWREAGAGPCVVSDGEGRFALPEVAPDGVLHVIPKTHERTFWIASGDGEATIELTPRGTRMTGRLLREDGRPLGGARVLLSGPLEAGSCEMTDTGWVHVLPEDGRLQIDCLQRDQLVTGSVEVDGTFVQFISARASEDLALGDLKVSVRGRIEGRIVAPDGSPLAGAFVMAQPKVDPKVAAFRSDLESHTGKPFGAHARFTVADRAGTFVFDGLAPGPSSVEACAPGIVPAALETVASAEPKQVVLRLERGHTITGRVVDEGGNPLAGRRVHLTFLTQVTGRSSSIPPAVTDDHGVFLFQGLIDKDRAWVWALPAGKGRAASHPVQATVGDDVELVLPPQR